MKKIGILVLMLVLSACSTQTKKEDTLQVVTTFFPTYSYAKSLDPEADVINIVGHAEAHGYEPSAKDIERIQKADLFVYNGAGFEPWIDRVLKSIDTTKVRVVDVSEGLTLLEGHDHDHDHDHEEAEHDHDHDEDGVDPHTWMHPLNAMHQLTRVKDAMVAAAPEKQMTIEMNYDTVVDGLKQVNEGYEAFLSQTTQKEIIVDHEAYTYLLEPYGIEQKSIIGGIFEEEPTAKAIEEAIALIKENNVTAIFVERFSNQKVASVIQKETGVEILELQTMESVTQEQKDKGATVITLFEENLAVLKQGLK